MSEFEVTPHGSGPNQLHLKLVLVWYCEDCFDFVEPDRRPSVSGDRRVCEQCDSEEITPYYRAVG